MHCFYEKIQVFAFVYVIFLGLRYVWVIRINQSSFFQGGKTGVTDQITTIPTVASKSLL